MIDPAFLSNNIYVFIIRSTLKLHDVVMWPIVQNRKRHNCKQMAHV